MEMMLVNTLRLWLCRCLRLLLAVALVVFILMCYGLWGEMDTFVRVIASILTAVAGCVVVGLAALIGRFCRGRGCVVTFKWYILVWAIAVFAVLALSITIPSCGGTFYRHKASHSEGHHWDWD